MNFIQGTLDLLVLKALAGQPLHGYDVVDWIRRVTQDTIQIEDGALYASLHRMEGRGWLDHEWRTSPKGRRAKYYRLTAPGRKALGEETTSWRRYVEGVELILRTV